MLLFAGGCGTVGHNQLGIDNFDEVSPDLFRGAQPTADGMKTLKSHHIQTVINLRDSDDSAEANMVRDAGMNYIHLPLDAETVTVADAEKFLTLLADASGPVFVHCLVGRDRTGMAVAAYRVRIQGWTQEAAIKDLINHGHFWLFYPKVREAITQLTPAKVETAIAAAPTKAPPAANPTIPTATVIRPDPLIP
jgi:uncharacterized protein (TIGR01244 family)